MSIDDTNQFAVWCLLNGREVFINDMDVEYADYIGEAGLATVINAASDPSPPGLVPKSTMYTPLIVNERVVGVLCVQSTRKNAYRRVHLDMLQTLAVHAAVGLDNARQDGGAPARLRRRQG